MPKYRKTSSAYFLLKKRNVSLSVKPCLKQRQKDGNKGGSIGTCMRMIIEDGASIGVHPMSVIEVKVQ
jgi:hypothetical protein